MSENSIRDQLRSVSLMSIGLNEYGDKRNQASLYGEFNSASLYPVDGGPVSLQEQSLQTVLPDRAVYTHILGMIGRYDIKAMADEVDFELRDQKEEVRAIFIKNALLLVYLLRGANYYSKSGFHGRHSQGRSLGVVMFRPEHFQNPDVAKAERRTTWLRNITDDNYTKQFICGSDDLGTNLHGLLIPDQNLGEALAILGFINNAEKPLSAYYQITYFGILHNIQRLFFINGVYELPEPLLLWPGEGVSINVRYSAQGVDGLQPFGVWFKNAQNLKSLEYS